MKITLQNHPCDRCRKISDELHPYKFSIVIYRGKTLETPWLCPKCFLLEKEKIGKKQYKNKGGA